MDSEWFEDEDQLYNLEQSTQFHEDYGVLFSFESEPDCEIGLENNGNPTTVVFETTIGRIWAKAKGQFGGNRVIDVSSRKRQRGRKRLDFNHTILAAIPIEKRTTIRGLAEALHLSHTTVYRLLRNGILRAHTNSIKPSLQHHHKIKKVQFIMDSVIPGTVNELPKFSAMYNMVHIDEKWFYMSDKTQRFYLFSWKDDPYRATQSKNFMEMVMVMAGTSGPHICNDGEIFWDGKVGVFPFTEQVAAKKNSKNRVAGTVETKALQSVTKAVIRSMLIDKMLPAIRSKWPLGACKEIWIQQDNSRPHISPNDTDFLQATTLDGFNIRLITSQPKAQTSIFWIWVFSEPFNQFSIRNFQEV
ncbi:uncharacterized protein LOC110737940 [Chenopodium quinoa]|uniref:uncharacterized protein LOC110737940 n=1 Tax=Chenopodium quinoa TaxID=63459 RepID=UPI000B77A2B9|nr:uncharacterized protein LOC110737940 [Chenopodium quinoa]